MVDELTISLGKDIFKQSHGWPIRQYGGHAVLITLACFWIEISLCIRIDLEPLTFPLLYELYQFV